MLREAYRLIDTPDQRLTVLTNGLTAILARNAAADVAAVRVYIRAGSIYEGRWAGTGISHLLEHVITGDGTARHSEAELLSLGESLGGLVNAYTAVDHICHHVTVSPEHIPHAIEMFADYVTGPRLSQAVFERERIVVLRELEQDRDDPEAQLEEMLSGILYRGHPLAYPVIGRREGVAALTREDLLNYYRQTHVPDGVVVVIAGDLDPDATARTILEAFKTWQWRPSPAIRGPALLPVLSRIRARRRMPVASAAATIGWRTVREGTVDDAALDLLGLVLGAGDDARLVKSLRWDRGLVHEVSASHDSTWHTPGTFQIDVRCDVARLETVEEAVLEEIERLEHAPITAAELQRAKQRVRVDVLYPSETAEGLAAQLGEDFLATGSVGYTEAYLASVRAASTDDLLRAARRHLRPDRFVSAAIVPESTRVLMSSAETRFAATTDRSELNPALVCLVRPMAWSSFVAVNVLWPGGLSAETEETNGVFNLM
ncbi:MAG: M16 family metallopeptidase, partial [Phycisphaerae bacterium]